MIPAVEEAYQQAEIAVRRLATKVLLANVLADLFSKFLRKYQIYGNNIALELTMEHSDRAISTKYSKKCTDSFNIPIKYCSLQNRMHIFELIIIWLL